MDRRECERNTGHSDVAISKLFDGDIQKTTRKAHEIAFYGDNQLNMFLWITSH